MNQYLKITLHPATEEQSEIWIALLSDIGFYAFETEVEILYAFIKPEDFSENELMDILGENSSFERGIIDEKNWNAKWESDFQPVIIDSFVGIRATFHQPVKNVEHEIIITPKMSFGTGHHATTELMIRSMQTIPFENKSVIDFGTGTGVLAILSKKLGADKVTALDNDDWCIENAAENFLNNRETGIELIKAESPVGFEPVDIFLANINLNVLLQYSAEIGSKLRPGGTLVLSGFYKEDVSPLEKRFSCRGFIIKEVLDKDNWAAVKFLKQGRG